MVYQITSCILTSSLILMCILAVFGVLAQCGYSWLCLSAASCFPQMCSQPCGGVQDQAGHGIYPSFVSLGIVGASPASWGTSTPTRIRWRTSTLVPERAGGVVTWARTAVIKIPLSCHQLLLWLTAFDTPAAQPPSLIWTAMPYSWVPSDNCSLGD